QNVGVEQDGLLNASEAGNMAILGYDNKGVSQTGDVNISLVDDMAVAGYQNIGVDQNGGKNISIADNVAVIGVDNIGINQHGEGNFSMVDDMLVAGYKNIGVNTVGDNAVSIVDDMAVAGIRNIGVNLDGDNAYSRVDNAAVLGIRNIGVNVLGEESSSDIDTLLTTGYRNTGVNLEGASSDSTIDLLIVAGIRDKGVDMSGENTYSSVDTLIMAGLGSTGINMTGTGAQSEIGGALMVGLFDTAVRLVAEDGDSYIGGIHIDGFGNTGVYQTEGRSQIDNLYMSGLFGTGTRQLDGFSLVDKTTIDGAFNVGARISGGFYIASDDVNVNGFRNTGFVMDGGAAVAKSDLNVNGELGLGGFLTGGELTVEGLTYVGSDYAGGVIAMRDGDVHLNNVVISGDHTFGVIASHGGHVDTKQIISSGDHSIAALARKGGQVDVVGGIQTIGDMNLAAVASKGGTINVTGDALTDGEGSHALTVSKGGTINMDSGRLLVTSHDDTWHMYVDRNGTINLNDVDAGSDDSLNLLYANRAGHVTAADSALIGNVIHDGSLIDPLASADRRTLTMDLTDSTLKGMVNSLSDDAIIDLNLERSTWLVTGDSTTHGGLHMGTDSALDYRPSALGTKVRVSDLSGSGLFYMKTDIVAEQADRLTVTNTSEGSHLIDIENSGSVATTGNESVLLVETADTNSDFSLTHIVELGAWQYDLTNSDDGMGEFDNEGGQHWRLGALQDHGSKPAATTTGSNAVNTFVANYLLNYAETDTLMKRLGDLRSDNYGDNGAWFRAFGGKFEADARGYSDEFDLDYWGLQLGYDRKLERSRSWLKNGDTYVGAFIGLGNGDMDFLNDGTGEADHRTLGMYATYIGDSGYYLDAIAKYVWMKNEFRGHDTAGTYVDGGHMNTGAVGLSLETGKRFRFNQRSESKKGAWYAEPQLQLSWLHTDSGSYSASNGLEIGVDGYDSLLGRAGVLFGYETPNTNFYAKASYLKEFNGDFTIIANSIPIYDTLDDSWWVYGIGMTHRVNQRNSLYLDFERASGGDFEQTWSINAGWRITF
ncbi:autotransporter outer membrane beta-barrel domain-containing protein, partial [Synergistaceae bacterium OttesenSCG-928-D05]|nr:autotransporter outer membrane beta-barrel domain-containing protein [Synergistaceae bacterium OttesenSCG-928-D05]